MKVGLCALPGLLLALSVAHAEPINPGSIKVTDGNTVQARSETYRLVGFDTPATWTMSRPVSMLERNLGLKAKQRLQELIASGPVDLKEVPCACTKETRRDKQDRCRTNNRLCAVLTVNGKDVGQTLIAEGLAREFVCTATECPQQMPWPEKETPNRMGR